MGVSADSRIRRTPPGVTQSAIVEAAFRGGAGGRAFGVARVFLTVQSGANVFVITIFWKFQKAFFTFTFFNSCIRG